IPRRPEPSPSLVRIDTINGASADTISDGARFDDLPVAYPTERLALGSQDPPSQAVEWATPRRQALEVTLVLSGARPEEIAQWQEGPVQAAAALSFAASADSQGQAVERAV